MLYDHLYNIVLMILLLNIVFGVVLDTFAEMRNDKDAEIQVAWLSAYAHLLLG